ncbi:baseplate J/gp47 family protein [Kineococcus terrestris]|uniref:baseplate J/gp47 family protein n=1 Tax=Kineococcus terrestris TaxID=2044856 RepID=UPI0034DAF49A
MAGYVDFPFAEDPDDVTRRILDGLAARIPGWTPGGEGTLEVALAEEIGREVADLRRLAVDVAAAAVRQLGQTLFGVTYLPGAAATLQARITSSVPGITIPAGFTAVGVTADEVPVAFTLPADVKMATGTSTRAVTLVASDTGTYANGVPTGPLTIATSTPSITSVVAETGPSAGGADPEADADYLDRLVATLSTLTRTPILPADFAVRAKDVAGVHRAVALDGYDPDTGATNAERTVTVVAVDEAGQPVGAPVRAAVTGLLAGLREANFVVKTAAPTYTAVNVVYQVRALPGFAPADVQAAVTARARQYLSPAVWAGGAQEPPVWRDERIVYYLDLAAELDRVTGVDRVVSLTVNGAAADFTLPGPAGLPSAASTITGTVS